MTRNWSQTVSGEQCGSMWSGNWLEIFKINETYSRQIRIELMVKKPLPCYSQTLTIIFGPHH
jgi:hypothetical protein